MLGPVLGLWSGAQAGAARSKVHARPGPLVGVLPYRQREADLVAQLGQGV